MLMLISSISNFQGKYSILEANFVKRKFYFFTFDLKNWFGKISRWVMYSVINLDMHLF